MIPGIIISDGWLSKKGSFRHNWKRRYFVLTTKALPTEPILLLYFANKPNMTDFASQEKVRACEERSAYATSPY